MFGIKHRKELKKEMIEEGLTPTKDLKVDTSLLSEEEKPQTKFPLVPLILIGGIIVIMAILIVLIYVTGGPIK